MRSLAFALLLMLGLAGCGTDTTNDETGSDPTPTPAAAVETAGPSSSTASPSKKGTDPSVAEELNFTAQTLEGASFDGTELAGRDAVFWFWAPWCTECRREAPFVAQSQADNSDVVFVGVAGLGEVADMRAFVDDYEVGAFEHLVDPDGSLWQRFGVVQQPAYAFVDDMGSVEVYRGALGEDGLAERVGNLTGN
ncbi:MAG: redoxin domain-containing protein [Candidatus Nanopelagicales bacterium]